MNISEILFVGGIILYCMGTLISSIYSEWIRYKEHKEFLKQYPWYKK